MNTSLDTIVQRSATRESGRMKIKNSSVSSSSGALGVGDRGAFSFLPFNSGNPYGSQDYVYRWRQYVQMYETSWEARKIIRIVPEDALRKPWEAQDIPEEMAVYAKHRLDSLQFTQTLKKSLMLERLLGGCLTFLGLEGEEDDIEKPFHPGEGIKLHFCNAIPVSRISRVDWCHDPLSEHYMRPEKYLINSQEVHVSRTLVWDGEPLFDPFDYALNNFRANLAGFGESKLAPIWDDIVKAVGTRQAAYQLIQTNNAIIMAVNDLADLQGTKSGKQAMKKLEDVANQISLYRAAMIDGEKVTISQQAASFGSVPELMMTYLQILSAASDIPATRFLGQAPGGLNATGESDLENYYNVIDAYQQQRIVPNIRRIYDIILFNKFGEQWKKERQKLDIKFPPLWNESELELAQRGTNTIDNIVKLVDNGLCGDKKALQEINAKGVLSVKLDDTDISVVDESGLGAPPDEPVDPEDQIQKLRNSVQVTFDPNEFAMGMKDEQEHLKEVGGDQEKIRQIVLDHLKDDPQYYSKLKKAGLIENRITSERTRVGRFLIEKDTEPESGTKGSWIILDDDLRLVTVDNGSGWNGVFRTKQEASQAALMADKDTAKYRNSITLEPFGEPTPNQIKSGNYKKHHLKLHGLDISIENPKGSLRKGVDPSGQAWESELPAHYGYIKKTEGADGDHVDIYLGDTEESELVFIVDQKDLSSDNFDEHKCIFGCVSSAQAKQIYVDGFSDGLGEKRLMSITPVHVDGFKQWLSDGDTTKPYGGEQ